MGHDNSQEHSTQPKETKENSDLDIYEKARQSWKRLGTKANWTLLFGDLYVKRFPVEVQSTSSATAVKKSIFEGDDSVHAWDASGVRKTIVERMIQAEARGIVREWYAELAFFAERMNFLKGIKEDEIDFIVRTSFLADKNQPHIETRENLLEKLDPPTKIVTESLKKGIILIAQTQLELHGFFTAMTKELFRYSEEELYEIISLLLDPYQLDMFLRVRFIDTAQPGDPRPLIGFGHPEVSTTENFALKYLANDDQEYFPLRIAQIWLYALLREFPEAKEHLEKQQSNILAILSEKGQEKVKKYLRDSILLARWFSIYTRLRHSIRTDYAYSKDYVGYSSNLLHLLDTQKEIKQRFDSESSFPIPFDRKRLEKDTILLDIGVTMVESVMKRLESQIPIPEGAGSKRSIMAKRRQNLRNAVLPNNIRIEIIDKVLDISNCESVKEIEDRIRAAGDTLFPRGEAYFKDMKDIVKRQMEAMGDLDLRKELQQTTDTPQSLVKQYGNTAINWLEENYPEIDPSDNDLTVYAVILSLKGTELMFSSATTSEEERSSITRQLFDTTFFPQIQALEKLTLDQERTEEMS